MKLAHLTPEQHQQLADLLNQAAAAITEASRLVNRAPFTDRALFVGGTLQEWLVDPLREAYDAVSPRRTYAEYAGPYQAVGYGGPHRRKTPPRDARA